MSGNKVEPLISPKDLELNANFLGSGNLDKICKNLFLLNCRILIVHPSPHCLDKKVGSRCLVLSTLRNGAPSVQLNGPLTGPLLCLCYVVPAPRKDGHWASVGFLFPALPEWIWKASIYQCSGNQRVLDPQGWAVKHVFPI